MLKKLLLVAAIAASAGTMVTPASAVQVGVSIGIAPPAPRVVVVPAPRVGYLWVPGYWNLRGQSHVWVGGTWLRERPGYAYQQPRWTEHEGRWQLERGRWARGDMDHDGVRNGADRDLDGDGVRNRADRDRDGDGVRNRADRKPAVPVR